MKILPWMVGLTGLLIILSPKVWALDINEELPNVRILDTHPNNIVVINRGVEDGISIGNHAKLRGAEGYATRGICIKTGMLTSHWRLYRIVDNQMVSKDLTYTLVGLQDSEPAPRMTKVRATDFTKKLPDYDETRLGPSPFVSEDLPTTLERDRQYLDSLKTKQTLFIEDTFDKEKMKRDFRIVRGSLYASPFSVQKGPNNVQNFLYGASVGNAGKKYLARVGFDKVSLRASEEKSGEDIVNDSTTVNGNFAIKEISPGWDAYSDVTWRQARYGSDYAPRRQYLVAPLGFTWKKEAGPELKRFELSYAPTYDSRRSETREPDGRYTDKEQHGLRHAFGLRFTYEVTPDFVIRNDLVYRPFQDIGSWAFDTSDHLTQNTFEASQRIMRRWFVAYEFRWLDDAQLRRMNHMTRIVTINSVNIRYDFDF